jgi:hypothetical protein
LKKSVPEVEFWVGLVEKQPQERQNWPVPAEVDALVIEFYFAKTPDAVRDKAEAVLPGWIRKAKDRPVMLLWTAWGRNGPGLVPNCQAGVLTMCRQIAEQYKLAGLMFAAYGEYGPSEEGIVGIESRPDLVSEVRAIAQDWGIGRREPAPHPSSQDTDEGFVSLFNGRDLAGWIPFRSWGPQQQPGGSDWIVRNGEFICDGEETAWLRSAGTFDDFVLALEFKIPADANSGVLVRCSERGWPAMEIQLAGARLLAEHEMDATWQTGAIFGAVGPTVDVQHGPDEWNTMQIRCEGDDVDVRMNGTVIVEANMQRVERLRNLPRSGYVGFLNSTSAARGTARGTALRNIRIRELQPPNQAEAP